MKWSKDEINFIIEQYPSKGSLYCSEKLNRDIKSVRLKVNRLKLKINKENKFKIYSKSNQNKWNNYEKSPESYKVNLNIFKNVSMPEIAYTLGFMWGDGYISSYGKGKPNKVSICHNIKEDIDDILHIFMKTGNWSVYNRKRKNRKEQTELITNNLPFCEYLIEHDYCNKSYVSPIKILQTIPDDLSHYFYLGLSDADGCFYINENKNYQYSITSTINQDWIYMINLCDKLKIKYNIRKVELINKNKIKNQYSQFRITNKIDVILFGKFIYKNFDNIGLKRKYDKYNEIVDKEIIIKNYNVRLCPHCNKEGRGPNMTRYHFDKCKKFKIKLER